MLLLIKAPTLPHANLVDVDIHRANEAASRVSFLESEVASLKHQQSVTPRSLPPRANSGGGHRASDGSEGEAFGRAASLSSRQASVEHPEQVRLPCRFKTCSTGSCWPSFSPCIQLALYGMR